MTDIVERLRNSLIDELRDQAEGNDLYSEAADEIERLRADIAQLDRKLASILLQLEADLSAT
jgi:hypothetical protein